MANTVHIVGEKEASVTPKLHDLWFEVLTHLGHLHDFMEDPMKKLHKIGRLMAGCRFLPPARL
jgi:hypothetical protein